jgi:hypothetical protein
LSAFDSLFSNSAFLTAFSSPADYERGELTASVVVMDSIISNQQQLEYGASLVTEAKEFQILVSALSVFGEPDRGDIITDSAGIMWQVAGFGSLPDWQFDADINYYRIRTVKIGGS